MTSMSTPTVMPRTLAVDGYVHKFRFESEPVQTPLTIETEPVDSRVASVTKERRLLAAFFASVVGLSMLLLGVVWVVQP